MVNELIRSGVEVWIEDIQRIFKYYTSRHAGNKIDEISSIKYAKELDMKDLDYYLNSIDYECILLMKIEDEGLDDRHIKVHSVEVKEEYYEENETKPYDLDPKPSLKITIVPDPNIL